MTITCPKCGKSVSSDYQFCPYCGGSLAGNGNYNNGGFGGQTNQGNTGFPPQPDFDRNGNPRTQQQQQGQQQSQWPFPNLNPGGNNGTQGGGILKNNAGCIAIIASFIIPLIGVVLYFVYRRKNNMQAAKKVLYAAIAGVAFNLLINVVGHGSQYSYFHNLMGN